MAETMPEYGAERNAAIARLLGWKDVRRAQHWTVASGIPPNDKGRNYYANLPDYCGDNTTCFELLVILQRLPYIRGVTLHSSLELQNANVGANFRNERDEWLYIIQAESPLPGLEGQRDAITQAAWLALTAANKETE